MVKRFNRHPSGLAGTQQRLRYPTDNVQNLHMFSSGRLTALVLGRLVLRKVLIPFLATALLLAAAGSRVADRRQSVGRKPGDGPTHQSSKCLAGA